MAGVEQKITQFAISDLDALLQCSAEPHRRLLELLLETNGESKEAVVEWLHAESRKSTSDLTYQRKCIKCLDAVVKRYHVFPSSFFIKDIQLDGYRPKKRGGFADIYKGTIGSRMMCLKLLRMYLDYDEHRRKEIITDFCKEVLIWTQLSHPNILPLIGVNSDLFEPEFCLVSPWMINDDIISFLKRKPDHDRLQSICDITAGLEYLHSLSPAIVHGDIKGGNVLVDENCNCLLSDFGLSKTITQTTGATTSTSSGGSVRWMAPELFDFNVASGERQYMPPRDIYAFACTILEIMTGKPPFPELHDGAVLHQVVNNHARPARPIVEWCPDEIWNLVTVCWHKDPSQRPEAASITAYLNGLKEGQKTGRALLLLHLISTPEKSLGIAGTINSLVAMGYSRYDVYEQMHKHNYDAKHILRILRRAPSTNADQSGVLLHTSIAATTISDRSQTYTYYQAPSGEIVEARSDGPEMRPIFRTALFTPLAAISYTYNGKDESRVFYVDQNSILQEYRCSSIGQWYFGDLGDLKIKASYNTSLAAVCWSEGNILHIRVFYQDLDSNIIGGVGCETGPWHTISWYKRRMVISDALQGTALSAVRFKFVVDPLAYILIYYQDINLAIREVRYQEANERCSHGEFEFGEASRCTPISATLGQSKTDLRVWWCNGRGDIVGAGWHETRSGTHSRSLGLLVSGLKPGTNFAAVDATLTGVKLAGSSGSIEGNRPTNLKVFYQNTDGHVAEVSRSFLR
ncbi:kinase-like protein [Marasmius fiardii PR-910]|nr:kinase-like protein [Marasmius fiardii PR-910]